MNLLMFFGKIIGVCDNYIKYNKRGNVGISVTLRRFRVTTVAVEKQ
jgi:hypothetical protein